MPKLNVNPERMRYQKNILSFWMCLLALAFNIVTFLTTYTSKELTAPSLLIGIDVLVNIVFMLLVFMASEKTKAYRREWVLYLLILAGVQVVRIFVVPLILYMQYQLSLAEFLTSSACLALSAVALTVGAIVCRIRAAILTKYLEEVGEASGH